MKAAIAMALASHRASHGGDPYAAESKHQRVLPLELCAVIGDEPDNPVSDCKAGVTRWSRVGL